jgi:hypothetical protein
VDEKLGDNLVALVKRFGSVYRAVVRGAEDPQGAGLVGVRKACERIDAAVGRLIVAPGVDAELRLRLQEARRAPSSQADRDLPARSRDHE